MGLMTQFKANKAYRIQQKGDEPAAIALYEECFAEGLDDARYVLAYAMLLLRHKEFEKAREFLIKRQKSKGMTPEYRTNLIVYYATCSFRLGEIDKGLEKLEQLFQKGPSGMLYQILGYLCVEKFVPANKADFIARAQAKAEARRLENEKRAAEEAQRLAAAAANGEEAVPAKKREEEPVLSPEEQWQQGIQKALDFNLAAVDYDDTDAVCLDNLGQTYYRVLGDKKQAKQWFEKAIAEKEGQIDTLYFLSRYDLEAGDTSAALQKLEKAASGKFTPLNYCDKAVIDQEIAKLKGESEHV